MPNDIKLQEGHPVDENLRPLKVGGKSTALEVSKEDVRVNNLYVSGTTSGVVATDDTKLPLAGGTMTGDLVMDSGLSITVSEISTGGNVGIHNGSDLGIVLDATNDARITLYSVAGSATDYVQLQATANGASYLTTSDAGADREGHLTIAPDGDTIITGTNVNVDTSGDITLDSETGAFIAKKTGTEFSVAGSSFAGMILGYTTVGIDAADDSYTLTTTMTVLDDAMKVKFVAPPSGVVEIFAQIYWDTSRRLPVLGLSDQDTGDTYRAISFPNATDVTNEHVQGMPPLAYADSMLRPHWVVTGLTAGTAYEWWFSAKTSAGTGGVLRWGGNVTNKYPPFIMKATALPTATADYAVYG